ncbi:selenoprotein o [Nannochloropsis gaditana]|uniref:Selenoprotein O n=1 Tax=Nannochloropsis gaditana TaxID=72520 RepID=W7TER6_9STRA|nr:selenoprotein o [Nannochloropsis gaditana]
MHLHTAFPFTSRVSCMPGTTGRAPGTLLSSFQTFLLTAALLLARPQPAASRSSRRLPKTAPLQTLALARPFLSVASRIGAHRPSVTSFARWSAAFQYFSAHSVFPTMRSEAVRAASDSARQAPGHSIPAASRPQPKTYTLETLPFDNLALRSLPLDPQPENFIRPVPNSVYSRVEPEPLKNPVLVALSPDALTDLLSLDPSELKREEDLAAYLGGNKRLPGSETYAHCYAGHQFGAFSGQLGDGAAISLGEVVGERGERCEIQLKGAGPTPYSRR